ncbi:MAG: hypothetical protein ACYTET_02935 [Planctomycetota bacterium]
MLDKLPLASSNDVFRASVSIWFTSPEISFSLSTSNWRKRASSFLPRTDFLLLGFLLGLDFTAGVFFLAAVFFLIAVFFLATVFFFAVFLTADALGFDALAVFFTAFLAADFFAAAFLAVFFFATFFTAVFFFVVFLTFLATYSYLSVSQRSSRHDTLQQTKNRIGYDTQNIRILTMKNSQALKKSQDSF